MAENCARPGCGHDHQLMAATGHDRHDVRTERCYAWVARGSVSVEDPMCRCPSYRAPEQQGAWEELRATVVEEREAEAEGGSGWTESQEVMRVAERLLGLYP